MRDIFDTEIFMRTQCNDIYVYAPALCFIRATKEERRVRQAALRLCRRASSMLEAKRALNLRASYRALRTVKY